MADPIFFNKMALLAKIESTYGVDPVPTGGANAIMGLNVSIKPMEGADEQRDIVYPYLGGKPKIPVGLYSTVEFDIELVGSGVAGTAPAWGPVLRALGMAEVIVPATSVTYTPISESMESLTVYFNIGGLRHVLKGARGTGRLDVNAQKIPVLKVTLTGTFSVPTAQALPTVDWSGFKDPIVATTVNTPVFTINGVSAVMQSFGFDLGNDVKQRLWIGRESILITGRDETISTKIEALPLGTLDPFTLSQNSTDFAVNITHGTVAGYIASINSPKCNMMRLESYENSDNILEWPLKMKPLPNAGNDQFSLELT